MFTRIKAYVWVVAVMFAASVSACSGSSPTSPSALSSAVASEPGTEGITLKGRVRNPDTGVRVTSVAPDSVPDDTPTSIRITGAGFLPGATVTIGDAATDVVVVSPSEITAMTPIRSAGTAEVVVTNPKGQVARWNRSFTFVGFSVTNTSSRSGLVGDALGVYGTGFRSGVTVTLDGVESPLVSQSETTLVTFLGPHAPGTVDVVVTNPDGKSRTFAEWFTYQSVSLSISAAQVTAGSPISVSWTAPSGRPSSDWVSIYRVGDPNESYGDWIYTDGRASGTFATMAPSEPGVYEFRYFAEDRYVDAARSSTITVVSSARSQFDVQSSNLELWLQPEQVHLMPQRRLHAFLERTWLPAEFRLGARRAAEIRDAGKDAKRFW